MSYSESHRCGDGVTEGNYKKYEDGTHSFKILSEIQDHETVTDTAAGKVVTVTEFLTQLKQPKPQFFYCTEINGKYTIFVNFKFTGNDEQLEHLATLGHSLSEPQLGVIRANLGLGRDVPATETFNLIIADKTIQSDRTLTVSIDTSGSYDGFCASPSVSKNRKSVSNDNPAQAQNVDKQRTAGKESNVATLLAGSAASAKPPSAVRKACNNDSVAPEAIGWETRVEMEMDAQKAAVAAAVLPLSPPRPAAVAKPPSAPKDRSPKIAPETMSFRIVDTNGEKSYGSVKVNPSDTFGHLLAMILAKNVFENITAVCYQVEKCHYDLCPASEADRTLASLGLQNGYKLYVTTSAPQPQKAAINNAKVPLEVAKPNEAGGENPYLAKAALVGAMATLVVAAAINRL